ncbi:MAG: hypothetical protein TEF_00255 [Rhizobiales bacterium NRL2]|jgi:phage gp36-like protein|nr:MAG: hypothetical protein TEF_00255 [Rhizobiales bacterium NRL2]
MTYTTKADMTARFGARELEQLTDRDGQAGAIVDSVLDSAIATAEAEINGYLVKRYTLPLADPPAQLTAWAADMARYYLHVHSVPETVRTRHEAAVKGLQQVARGLMSLGDDDAGDSAAASEGAPEFTSPGRTFSRQSLKGL